MKKLRTDDLSSHAVLTKPHGGILPLSDVEGIIEVRDIEVAYDKHVVLKGAFCHFPKNGR